MLPLLQAKGMPDLTGKASDS